MAKFVINNFSGGLADGLWAGTKNSFAQGSKCLDIHSEPGLLKTQYKLTKDSGTTITGLPLWGFVGTDGKSYWFDDAGGCYCRTAAGVWSLDKALGVRVCGAIEYNDYIYVATSDTLYRVAKGGGTYALASLGSWQTWTGAEIDTSWHPCIVGQDNILYIGAGQYLSSVNSAGTWNSQALDLPVNWAIRCLAYMGNTILIGANYSASNFNLCGIFPWDGLSDSFFYPCYVNAPSINALLADGNLVIFQAGSKGRFYQYLGGTTKSELKQLPGTYTPTAIMDCYPGSVAVSNGLYYFGVGNSTGDPCDEGVYTFGALNKNYPKVWNLEYVISQDKTSAISLGAIVANGNDLFVAWKDGTTYGVDKVDYTARYASAVYNTTVIGDGNPTLTFKKFTLSFEPLPSSTSLTLKYKVNRGSSWTSFTDVQAGAYSTAGGVKVEFDYTIVGGCLELQVGFGIATTNTPKLKKIEIDYEPTDI